MRCSSDKSDAGNRPPRPGLPSGSMTRNCVQLSTVPASVLTAQMPLDGIRRRRQRPSGKSPPRCLRRASGTLVETHTTRKNPLQLQPSRSLFWPSTTLEHLTPFPLQDALYSPQSLSTPSQQCRPPPSSASRRGASALPPSLKPPTPSARRCSPSPGPRCPSPWVSPATSAPPRNASAPATRRRHTRSSLPGTRLPQLSPVDVIEARQNIEGGILARLRGHVRTTASGSTKQSLCDKGSNTQGQHF